MLDPIIYALELTKKMKIHKTDAWLVNTGWMGGPYGTGKRIDLPSTRKIIDAILNDTLKNRGFKTIPVFNLSIPLELEGIDNNLLDPAKAWSSIDNWIIAANDLARKFINNFSKFESNPDTASLAKHGPAVK
jgi:phosphoenolpyruvate carboxykinase (ATP)